jgi:high-affinity Fe2+/Pb2+ permease
MSVTVSEFFNGLILYGVYWDLFYVLMASLLITTLIYFFRERATKKIIIDLGKDTWIIKN